MLERGPVYDMVVRRASVFLRLRVVGPAIGAGQMNTVSPR